MGTEPLTSSAGGGGCTKSRSRRCTQGDFTQLRAARMRKTLLLLCGLYCVLAQERAVLQYTRAAGETGRGDGCPLFFYVRMGPPFICSRGYPQVTAQVGAKMGECCSGYSCLHSGCTVLSYLTLTAGDKGIKCLSASPRRCREVDRQERHRLPRWLLCQLRFATACPWLHNLPPRAPGMPPERHVGG